MQYLTPDKTKCIVLDVYNLALCRASDDPDGGMRLCDDSDSPLFTPPFTKDVAEALLTILTGKEPGHVGRHEKLHFGPAKIIVILSGEAK